MKRFSFLREKYPRFVYKSYAYKLTDSNLKIVFDFRIEPSTVAPSGVVQRARPDIRFKPEIVIKNIEKARIKKIEDKVLNNFVFHLGLMEMLSYWKATCSKEIVIKAGCLNKEQLKWWHDLIINGMGQFFYENKIDWRSSDFLEMAVNLSLTAPGLATSVLELKDRYLVPVGGGKDSLVTLEKLKKQKKKIGCLLVNPTGAAKKVVSLAGIKIKKPILVERKIDSALLKLNEKGFLNGHTPFTAVLSFLSVFCAVLFDYQHIAFSNEKSADEGNVRYLGKIINHQYSKSSEFERKFKSYCQKYLTKNIYYFSFLRKYTELEIAKMFTKYPKYFSAFSSCNSSMRIGAKEIRWCSNCPKCLFVYATLYPFLKKQELLKIFGKDIFENKKLLSTMQDLMGQARLRLASARQGRHKPFECVGTFKESRLAFRLSLKKAQKLGKIPYLLTKI